MDTAITVLEEVFPGDTNPYGTAFGGKIMALMDRAAGLAASRWAHLHFATASAEEIRFETPVRQGEVVEMTARVVYASRHTCGVKVEGSALDKTAWERRRCCSGLLFMVAVGPDGKPLEVPELTPRTEAEQRDWDVASDAHRRSREAARRVNWEG